MSPSVVNCANKTRMVEPARELDAPGITYHPEPELSSTKKLPPDSKAWSQAAAMMDAFNSPAAAEAGPSIPMVTQLSKASSGRRPKAGALMFDGVGPPKMASW